MADAEVGGQLIRKGDKIILHYHTVNHDESIFGEDAMEFDVTAPSACPTCITSTALRQASIFAWVPTWRGWNCASCSRKLFPACATQTGPGGGLHPIQPGNGIKRMAITFDPR